MGKTVTSVVSAGLMIAGVIATGGLGTALIVAGIAVQAASAFIFKDKVPGSGYRDQSERKQMLRSASAPETVVVGKTMMSGLLFFAEEEEGEQDENEELYMALAIASHPIHKLGQIYFNDDKIEDLGDNAQYEFHNGRTEADPYLLKHAPSWKEDMIGRGLAWLRLTLRFDQEKFPYGVPNVKSELWGKEIYDPRTEKTAWSNNGALVILDYYRHYLGVPDSDIDWNAFKVAADICDETVQTPDGKSEPRYTLNGAYELEESPASVLEMMHKCIAGEPTYIAGKHGILMQVYNGPALLTIDESQIIDTVTVTPELSLRDATNAIYGTFVDAEQQYNKTDFEPVVIEEWIEEDGLEIKENMDYRFVTSPYQANRLANLYLRKKRAGRRIQLRMNLDGYAYRPGDVIKLELPSLGISDLEFRIADWKFHPSEGVEITLEEDGPYIYEDLASKPFVRPPFTKLPTGGVPAPINLAFAPLSVTDIVQGYISWQNVASDIRYNTVNILQNGKVIQSIQVPGERVDINGLTRGTYRVEVRAINVAGAMSAPAISDFAIQGPPAPIGVEITPGMFSLTASPRQGDSAVFGYTFEFWFSEKKLANLSENEVITKTNKVGQGNFWTQENLKAGHTYYFYVRTINSYGKSPFVEASGVCSAQTELLLDELAGQISRDQLAQDLLGEINSKANQIDITELHELMRINHDKLLEESMRQGATIEESEKKWEEAEKLLAERINQVSTATEAQAAAIKQEQQARIETDKTEAQQRQFLATQLRGDYTGNDLSKVTAGLISAEKQARVTGDQAEAKARQSLETRMNGNVSAINKSLETLTSKQQAQTQEISTLNSNLKGKADSSAVNALNTRVSNIDGKMTATAQQVTRLESQVGTSSAKIEQTSKVVTDINGKISASWTMKVQQDSKGNKVITGIGLGFNAQGNSQFLVNAQNFAVISSLNGKVVTPFIVKNGQVVIHEALMDKAWIQKLVVLDYFKSSGFDKGNGFLLDAKNNVFRFTSGNGGTTLTNQNLYVKDETGYNVVIIGDITNER
ncbi:DUF1983 domain-containing protein [Proteus mirabilis]|uniref:Phage tail protein n=2 Tax=Proteus mirabilis TaxID=584 RepID=A0AAJ0Y9D3_PROMI|nr:DUF1983 domain-containing protein [Proteus mirabilis]ARX35215.1 phage tail protein [Proteus mirabilis]ELS9485922.1 DUF1983 domain-containing protein [Proteus mirabilis]MBQ0331967.1 DUF1983 domain-containing protein [Proteus mirabilis]MDZ7518541.1 DUF1983 domain-containing protein [Proteus mirabilis]MEB3115409.1 DUF1983 domain-containing protein [Proteus mirabilis]